MDKENQSREKNYSKNKSKNPTLLCRIAVITFAVSVTYLVRA